jgi:hypothetical protein
MTDLLESTDADHQPTLGATTPTGFPPPPPKSLDDGPDLKAQRILAVLTAIALAAAIVMGLLWFSVSGSRDDAASERDAAQAAVAAETERTSAALDSLAATEAELEAAQSDNEQIAAELAAAEADAAEATAATARATEAEALLAEVNVQNETLAAEITALEAALADAEAAAQTAESANVPTVPATPEPVVFDIDAAPDFARYLGEQLSSTNGASVLGQGQNTCLGTAVVNDIGLDALGNGLRSGASSNQNTVVVDAIGRAAVTCGIDPSAIF